MTGSAQSGQTCFVVGCEEVRFGKYFKFCRLHKKVVDNIRMAAHRRGDSYEDLHDLLKDPQKCSEAVATWV